MAHYLLKTEPSSYSWADLARDGGTEWDGVRNHAAAGFLRKMQPGDRVLIYHSMSEKAAVGVAEVTRAAKTNPEEPWVSVAIEPVEPLANPVTLAAMKADPRLAGLEMIRQSRLSVSPVTDEQWAALIDLARG